jgi:hypothetical protein
MQGEATQTEPISLALVASNVIQMTPTLRRLDRLDPDEIALIRAALNGGCPILTNLKRTD